MRQLFDYLAFGTDPPAGRAPGVFADSVVDKIARLAPNRMGCRDVLSPDDALAIGARLKSFVQFA
jgi:hypothetical protein